MRISIKYQSYNGRRYGKPWIGIIPMGGDIFAPAEVRAAMEGLKV